MHRERLATHSANVCEFGGNVGRSTPFENTVNANC